MNRAIRDMKTGMPLFVEAAPWMQLLTSYTRPVGIPANTWWTWTNGHNTPALVNLSAILATIGIPEADAIIALGWSKVPIQLSAIEKANFKAEMRYATPNPAMLPDRVPTLADVERWATSVRLDLYRTATLEREMQRILALPPLEQAAAKAAIQEKAQRIRQDNHQRKSKRQTMRDHEAVGLKVPKKPDGSYDVKAFFKNASQNTQLTYLADPDDFDVPEQAPKVQSHE